MTRVLKVYDDLYVDGGYLAALRKTLGSKNTYYRFNDPTWGLDPNMAWKPVESLEWKLA
jgi:hypothetical protein